MEIKWNTKAVLYGIIALILVIGGFLVVPKFLGEKGEPVEFTLVERDEIPEKILDVMPKYVDEERALACKIQDKIYVIATRGENKDYGVEIEKIEMLKDEDKITMKVYSVYKKPENSHPYIVVETNLKELPDKVELINKVEEE
ncbi:hypothetical protein [Tepidibacter formicigenes]|uniref:PrcB C-terminal n=1 Tax=Tepidibacter formicigenes DSM 15518 TaxID=1123349 RepID=A0A1M6SZD0_9FIRM|nr:hypothetical protein [Tepidibacter formicigenes]SHK50007.1 hypothetical protein SAMN02744037_02469 [Tepidibacter formicigenes DSM 15518]